MPLLVINEPAEFQGDQARAQFSETELVTLTLAIVAINDANRLNIAFRIVPGSHRVRRTVAATE